MNPKKLEWLLPNGTSGGCSSHSIFLWLKLFIPCCFPRTINFSGFSQLSAVLTHLWLHTHRFTHCFFSGTLSDASGFLPKSEWKSSWFHSYCILYVLKTITIWMMARSAASLDSSQVSLTLGCRGPVPMNQILRNEFPRPLPFWNMVFLDSLLKANLLVLQCWACKA